METVTYVEKVNKVCVCTIPKWLPKKKKLIGEKFGIILYNLFFMLSNGRFVQYDKTLLFF